MRDTWIDQTSKVTNTKYGEGFKCYRNAVVIDSEIGVGVTVGDDTTVARCKLGNNVGLNRRSYFNDSLIGAFSYAGSNTTMNFSSVGKFCSLARNVDIGGFDHDYHKITTMPMFRFKQLSGGGNPEVGEKELCMVGNDVWIAAGTQILHKVSVGDGAVIGGGAVVTKDVPPYAIVAGVPARIIKFRFDDKTIEELMDIKWWDWPEDVVLDNIEWMIKTDINTDTLARMREISKSLAR